MATLRHHSILMPDSGRRNVSTPRHYWRKPLTIGNLCKKLMFLAALMSGVIFSIPASASGFGIKTNLLYDATTTPNIGAEISLGGKSTFNIVYGLNPWKFKSDRHGDRYVKHWLLMPEYRWWACSRLNGHFIGVHALGGQLNASNIDLPAPGVFFSGPKLNKIGADSRYQGWYTGGGFTYGYQYPLSDHWNLEAEIGVGYAHMWYDQYPCSECGTKIGKGHANYAGLTKLGFSIMYVF